MVKYETVKTTHEHVVELAQTMRQADIEEAWAGWHLTPLEALEYMFKITKDMRTWLIDGEVGCIFGTVPPVALSSKGVPWMLTSEIFPHHFMHFCRGSVHYLEEMKEEFEFLENYVDARNKDAIRWLKWLGFEFDNPAPFGRDQMPFMRFTIQGYV